MIIGFFIGLLGGLLIAVILIVVSLYLQLRYREPIVKALDEIEAKTRPKGSIYVPLDDAEAARELIIKRNDELGRDTHISELEDK